MNKLLRIPFLTFFLVISGNTSALTISQCVQPDGTIEFTNNGCSKSNQLQSKRTFRRNFTQSNITSIHKKKRSKALFTRSTFIHLQNKLLGSENLTEMEQHARKITDEIRSSAQQGKIFAAFDMVAATYAKLSKDLKKKQWQGQAIADYSYKIHSLFEEILITQSTISSAEGLEQAINTAWEKYQTQT